jgi:hypothetical protein
MGGGKDRQGSGIPRITAHMCMQGHADIVIEVEAGEI